MNILNVSDLELLQVSAIALLIFLARAVDVTLATLRILFASRGYQRLSSLVGFFESILWLLIIQQVMNNMSSFINIIAYAGGFSAGTILGISLEKRLSLGDVLVRIIISDNNKEVGNILRCNGFGVTEINGSGRDGDVILIFTLIPRKHLSSVKLLLDGFGSSILYTAEDIRLVKGSGRRWNIEQQL